MDLDIQDKELAALTEPGLLPILGSRVRRLQIGTHAVNIHQALRNFFVDAGWWLIIDHAFRTSGSYAVTSEGGKKVTVMEGCNTNLPDWELFEALQQNPLCTQLTRYGPVFVRDGLLGFLNPNFFDQPSTVADVSRPYEKACAWFKAAALAANSSAVCNMAGLVHVGYRRDVSEGDQDLDVD